MARTAAKNFYYGFMVLPRRKRNALSAVYAFMRHADDICDDPGMTIPERRVKLHDWLEGYHRVAEGEPTDDPVFLALRDSQQHFGIPIELLDKLVHGTGMDLQDNPCKPETGLPVPRAMSPLQAQLRRERGLRAAKRTAGGGLPELSAELYDYCYHVASVVGLVCIRIFGYRDPDAEPLAEHVGIAFQLTNILRDIKEDAQMGRIYLPREDLAQHGITPEELASGAELDRLRPLLKWKRGGPATFMRQPSSCCR